MLRSVFRLDSLVAVAQGYKLRFRVGGDVLKMTRSNVSASHDGKFDFLWLASSHKSS